MKVLDFINREIKDFKKDKDEIPEKYRNVEPTIKNQEMRINATLATLNCIKSYIEDSK